MGSGKELLGVKKIRIFGKDHEKSKFSCNFLQPSTFMLHFCSECSDMVSNIFTYDRNVVCFETRNCVCHDVSFYYIIWSKALLGVRIDRR